jgi:hypothetical protein
VARGKGWVAGVSDTTGLSLSGSAFGAFHVYRFARLWCWLQLVRSLP